MKRPLLALLMLCVLALAINAQEKTPTRSAERTVILDLRMAEINSTRAEDLERIAREKNRLEAMIAEGSAQPVATLQMRMRPNEQNRVSIGQRVPVQAATLPVITAHPGGQSPQPGFGVPQINYEFGGLTVKALPRLLAGDQIEVSLELEMTGVDRSTGNFTPTFTQRTMHETVLLRQNEPALLMGLIQDVMLAPAISRSSNTQPVSQPRGNFVVLVSARLID
ncbi:MAG TPA: hypothetical protein VKA60_21075 [Blastocatellia bacterium]|nr:hypothetical protein [Blastocatellia bacterium]